MGGGLDHFDAQNWTHHLKFGKINLILEFSDPLNPLKSVFLEIGSPFKKVSLVHFETPFCIRHVGFLFQIQNHRFCTKFGIVQLMFRWIFFSKLS